MKITFESVFLGTLFLVSSACINISIAHSDDDRVAPFSSTLPLIHLLTEKPGQPIGKEEESAGVVIQNSFTNSSDDLLKLWPLLRAKVKIRGNGSAKFAKHQYDLEFYDPRDSEAKV